MHEYNASMNMVRMITHITHTKSYEINTNIQAATTRPQPATPAAALI